MLKSLRLKNIAVISSLEIEFGAGLNVLTGETGSGKSIIVDSLNLLMGTRASAELIRTGADSASVEALFDVSYGRELGELLERAGIPCEEEGLIIKREISASGKNKTFINNAMATLSVLRELGPRLVDIHGQHEGELLLDPSTHLRLLDLYGDNARAAEELADCYRRLRELDAKLSSLEIEEQERLRRIDLLAYQARELEQAALSEEEEAKLEAERLILQNAERLFTLAAEAYELLYNSEGAVLELLRKARRRVEELAAFDQKFQAHTVQLETAALALEDLAYALRDYSDSMDFSPERLDSIEKRLSEIERLKRKYGRSVAEVLAYYRRVREELNDLEQRKERADELEKELAREKELYLKLAMSLSDKRKEDAEKLAKEVRRAMAQLAMPDAKFSVRFLAAAGQPGGRIPSNFTARGLERIEFMVSTNRGEELKSLARVASGGELSRLMLALKSIVAGDDQDKTLIFDEVDSGIGGRTAEVVGRKLRELASRNQVICVTHLPQIASFANWHCYVYKETRGGRTETFVEKLEGKRRVEEIARMLGGSRLTDTATKHAREMLQLAEDRERRG